jgi:hypothetical protein
MYSRNGKGVIMKITEKIERECCERADLKRYNGMLKRAERKNLYWFCGHCGQIYESVRVSDSAGGTETELKKVEI